MMVRGVKEPGPELGWGGGVFFSLRFYLCF